MSITLICLDADDTLWHHGSFYMDAKQRFGELLAPYIDADSLAHEHAETERRNIGLYGYGAKSFTLSIIETGLRVGGDRIDARTIRSLLEVGRSMVEHPIELLEGVEPTIAQLSDIGRLVLVTKGDLFLQEAKLASSGLGDAFSGVEIVSDKTVDTYRRIFRRYGVEPDHAVMAGNSVRSDVLPALEAGAYAALVPYDVVWAHEAADAPFDHPRFRELSSLNALPGWISQIR
jgi:putative hydrolase of the HAD superfamily